MDYFKDYPEAVKKNLESMPELKKSIIDGHKRFEFVEERLNKLREEFKKEFGDADTEYYLFNSLKAQT